MELIDKIILLVVALQAVHWLYTRIMGGVRALGGEQKAPPAPEPILDPRAPQARGRVEDVVRHLEEAGEEAELLEQRLRRLDRDLAGSDGPVAVLREVIADPTLPDVEAVQRDITAALATVREADAASALAWIQRGELHRVFVRLTEARQRTMLLQMASRWRTDRLLAEVMADGDAMAAALLAPLADFARTHGVEFPDQRPVCVPTERGREAVLYELLPGHPVIFVPPAFGEDMVRWASLAHEVGHVMWSYVPGFAHEAMGLVEGGTPWLPRLQGRQVVFDVEAVWARWLPELVADAFGALLLGPAALQGMVGAFERPDDPEAVVRVDVGGDGRTVGSHPPAHVRVMVIARLLERMGYDQEIRPILRGWDATHGAPDRVILPTLFGQAVTMPAHRLVSVGADILDAAYTRHWDSLAGYPLSAVHGLELSPGMWAQVLEREEHLANDRPFHDDPRVVLAAAIMAAAREHTAYRRLAKGVRHAVLGLGIRERRMADRAYHRPGGGGLRGPLTRADIVDAVVLRTVLKRRGDKSPQI